MSDLDLKWVRLAPNETNSGLFQIRFQYLLCQNVLKFFSEKNSYLGQSDPPWAQICQPSPASPVHVCSINDVLDTIGTNVEDVKVCSLFLLSEILKIHGSIHSLLFHHKFGCVQSYFIDRAVCLRHYKIKHVFKIQLQISRLLVCERTISGVDNQRHPRCLQCKMQVVLENF